MTFTIEVDGQEYIFDLSNHLDELKEKADIYAKSNPTNEEKELLKNPALVVTEDNYKIVIN
jgi:hypothetical protein